MRSEDLSRVIESFGPSEDQKQRMFDGIAGHASIRVRRKGGRAKVLAAVVAISLFSGTVAAFSHTELFKGIFGNSIYLVEDQLLFPMESAADEWFRLTLEGVLSDDYGTAVIVSVEALHEDSQSELEHLSSRLHISPLHQNIRSIHSSAEELHHLSEKNKKRFLVEFQSNDGPLTGHLEVGLTTEKSRLALSVPTASTIQTITVRLDEGHYASADYVPQTVFVSPLRVVVTGHERTAHDRIPNPDVVLHFADGTTLDVFKQETGFGGARFPEEGVTSVSAPFENIIDLDQLASISVDGVEYPARDE